MVVRIIVQINGLEESRGGQLKFGQLAERSVEARSAGFADLP
jgi:hypothetical protein